MPFISCLKKYGEEDRALGEYFLKYVNYIVDVSHQQSARAIYWNWILFWLEVRTLHVSCLNAVSHALSNQVFASVLCACFSPMCSLLSVINRSTETNWNISCANLKRFNFRFGQLVWNI